MVTLVRIVATENVLEIVDVVAVVVAMTGAVVIAVTTAQDPV